jgi:hypothetical protein
VNEDKKANNMSLGERIRLVRGKNKCLSPSII